jgi:hypothetical protein
VEKIMGDKIHKYLLILNSLILLINLFLVGWQIKGQYELNLGYLALDMSVEAIKEQHGAISATYQKRSSSEPVFNKKTKLCSTPDYKMALELDPGNQKAIYWPNYDHKDVDSSEFQEYKFRVSDSVVVLENPEEKIPYRIFRIIEVFHHETKDVIIGLSGIIDMYSDWCRD